jgi:His-Xaa-Ser system protein HxsD
MMKFNRELYSKTALLKAAYNFTDRAYVHLDVDNKYYFVELYDKEGFEAVEDDEFLNEMLSQSVRHVVYQQTKDIRELLMARAMSTTLVTHPSAQEDKEAEIPAEAYFSEDKILQDWFKSDGADTE